MRTLKYFSMMLAMLVCCVGFVGCSSDDDDNDSKSLYGAWVQNNDDYSIRIIFKTNSTGSFVVTQDNGQTTSGTFEFDYDEIDKEIEIISTNPWAQINLVGKYDVTITPSILRLSPYYGNFYYEFKRE